jgi:sterol desaturase/sphingolipid hydroxylase (fatty acid hydroxylase superfamily)
MDVLNHQAAIRLGCFAGVLLLMTLWEALAPRRPASGGWRRWLSNLSLVAVGNLAARLLVPLGAVAMALLAEERGWGLLRVTGVPWWAAVVLSVVALDLAVYLQHVMFHAVPLLWLLHLVHHADLHFDATTGVRFHPVEIVLSMFIKLEAVALLGAPPEAVLLFEVLLNATSVFNHGNVSLPGWLDWLLRLFLVTPDMHRVHHSVDPRETNSNFGFNLSWWDHLFGTYRSQPARGHEAMTVGLAQVRDEATAGGLPGMLLLPLTAAGGPYPLSEGVSEPGKSEDPGNASPPAAREGAHERARAS